MNIIRKIKLKKIKDFMFYLCLWDISTDICYLLSRPVINPYFWKLSIATLIVNLCGPAAILLFGFVFNTILQVLVFKVETFNLKKCFGDISGLLKLSHAFVFKTLLDQDVPRKKAFYRTAFLLHITFESFPQLVLQILTNQKLNLWYEPFGLVSIFTSGLMILFTIIITIKTDKYYL